MKSSIKIGIQWFCALVMLPFTLLFFVLSAISTKDKAITGLSQLLSLLPGISGCYLRAGFYRFTLKRCHPSAHISFGVLFSQAGTEIFENVYIGPQCNIGLCRIEQDCLIGSGVHILSGKHQHNFSDLSKPIREQGGVFTKVEIGENVWLGNCAVVMANVGSRAVIAAASVVTKDIEKSTIAAGNPARSLRSIENNEKS